jgi:uncharacterized protein
VAVDHVRTGGPFAFLYPFKFMRLTTFRKSGVPVPTTVWFAPDLDAQDKLYVMTSAVTGKLKRIHNNGRVVVAPSDRVGNLLDGQHQVGAFAHELPSTDHQRAISALSHKYGAQFDAVIARAPSDQRRTYIEIEPLSK